MRLPKILHRPSDVERLLLLWDDVLKNSKERLTLDSRVAPQDKESALAVYDTIHMEFVSRLVQQAHGKAAALKTTTTKSEKTETTTTG